MGLKLGICTKRTKVYQVSDNGFDVADLLGPGEYYAGKSDFDRTMVIPGI